MISRGRTIHHGIAGLIALVLVGCSNIPYTAPAAPAADAAVAEILPTGAYTVAGQFVLKGNPRARIEGFVDFGTSPDGIGCEADSTITDISADAKQSPLRAVREVRAAGGTTWYQDLSDPTKPGEWVDIADPAAPIMPLLFVPAIIASDFAPGMFEGAGAGILCSIGIMSRFMSVEGEQLVFDTRRTGEAVAAVRGRWVEQFLDALGLRDSRAAAVATELTETPLPTYEALLRDTAILVEYVEDGGFLLTQIREGKPMVELRFTRAEDSVVPAVGSLTYFERIAVKVKEAGVDSVLNGIVP